MAIYHSACLSGLTWQVAQISINYFQFETVSDIKVTLPEEYVSNNNALNLCFKYFEVMNVDVFSDLLTKYDIHNESFDESRRELNKKILIGEIFKLTLNFDVLFRTTDKSLKVTKYLYQNFVCFRLHDMKQYITKVRANIDMIKNVTVAYISFAPEAMHMDRTRFRRVTEIRERNVSTIFLFDFALFTIQKLSWPYKEMCINYSDIGFISRHDAINNCMNDDTMSGNNEIYPGLCIFNNSVYNNHRYASKVNEIIEASCKEKYKDDDCFKITIFTNVKITDGASGNSIEINAPKSSFPSNLITSKPMINVVDFFTFNFGALATWIGFSFIDVNPFKMWFKKGRSAFPLSRKVKTDVHMGMDDDGYNLICSVYLKRRLERHEIRNDNLRQKLNRIDMTLSRISI